MLGALSQEYNRMEDQESLGSYLPTRRGTFHFSNKKYNCVMWPHEDQCFAGPAEKEDTS